MKNQEIDKEFLERFKKGNKIHIKKSHEGRFTDYCGGNVTLECINRGKSSSSPKIRKMATFAANARKWKHKEGGSVWTKNAKSEHYVPKHQFGGTPSLKIPTILMPFTITLLEEQRKKSQEMVEKLADDWIPKQKKDIKLTGETDDPKIEEEKKPSIFGGLAQGLFSSLPEIINTYKTVNAQNKQKEQQAKIDKESEDLRKLYQAQRILLSQTNPFLEMQKQMRMMKNSAPSNFTDYGFN